MSDSYFKTIKTLKFVILIELNVIEIMKIFRFKFTLEALVLLKCPFDKAKYF